jgi:hypothetical protein
MLSFIICIVTVNEMGKSRDSSVGIALGYGLDDRGSRVRFPGELGIFLFTTASRTAPGPTQPPIRWMLGALSVGVKRPGCEADHLSPSTAKFKNEWSCTSTPTIRLHGVGLSLNEMLRAWSTYGEYKKRVTILVGKSQGKRGLGRSRLRWMDIISVDLEKRIVRVWNSFSWLRIGSKSSGISWPAE